MSGRKRIPFIWCRAVLFMVASAAVPLMTSGCADFRQALGMDRVGPDEFAVESRAPLTIPPEFNLRPPQPGAPRPQEVTAAERARRVVDTAGPGEPGKQTTEGLKVPAGGLASGPQSDPSQEVGPNSLAAKLLGSNDNSAGGTVQSRETTTLKGVY
jgi:DUF3035 family protein